MSQRVSGQYDLADSLLGNNRNLNRRLDKVGSLVDWSAFEKVLNGIYSSSNGRPSHPLLLLFKCLLLQTWHALSDYDLEEMLDDRISFRRFVNLSLSEKAPDHSTFSRFRDQLIRHGVKDQLFEELDRQLQKIGLIVKKGTLVDATVIEAAVRKPNQNSDGTAGKSTVDPEANWTKKGGRYLFGYKAHIGVDQESELIKKIAMTPASTHDGEMLGNAITGEEEWVFADKAYDSEKNANIIEKKGIKNGILFKGTCKQKLGDNEKRCNRILSKLRVPVERVFGTFKRSYLYARARYIGLRRNILQLVLVSMAYNLNRMAKLCA